MSVNGLFNAILCHYMSTQELYVVATDIEPVSFLVTKSQRRPVHDNGYS